MRLRVGVDLVPVPRVERLLASEPDVLDTLLTERERAYCTGRRRFHEHVGARFAAKEAVLKALGTGVTAGVRWTDIEVTNEFSGRPGILYTGRPRRRHAAPVCTRSSSRSRTATAWRSRPPSRSSVRPSRRHRPYHGRRCRFLSSMRNWEWTPCECYQAYQDARQEADGALAAWQSAPVRERRDAFTVYRAASDREDALADAWIDACRVYDATYGAT